MPKENTKRGAELVIVVNPIGGGDATPETGSKTRNKSPVKRPYSAPTGASPHKKKKPEPVVKVLFAEGTDPPGDKPDLGPVPEDPGKDPPGDPGGPPGGGDPPPEPPPVPLKAPTPKKPKMGSTKLAMKDVPLYKKGEDPIVFITSFMSYLNYYNIDPTTVIPKEGEP